MGFKDFRLSGVEGVRALGVQGLWGLGFRVLGRCGD